ncbi:uncharacterized protein LOC118347644 [Juglans regia]|uniref:Uncharacterized protein LOC118347644 n=1 Tax=Juglans regia TaxID=51240 RepID=A0A6P9E610_JUGRE|nr:uncharacterized protein LOC118347644 [Juglans regia]
MSRIEKFDSTNFGYWMMQIDYDLYGKDFIFLWFSFEGTNNLKKQLSKLFRMYDFGVAKQVIGKRIIGERIKATMRISQGEDVNRLLKKFNMDKVKLVGTPKIDVAHAVGVVRLQSTASFVYAMGGAVVSWGSNLQKIVDLSTIEAEYIVVSEVSKDMIWF